MREQRDTPEEEASPVGEPDEATSEENEEVEEASKESFPASDPPSY